jgi:hypothetical protein
LVKNPTQPFLRTNPLHTNTLASDFKLRRRVLLTQQTDQTKSHQPITLPTLRSSTHNRTLFRLYLRVTSVSAQPLFAVHAGFRFLFLAHSKSAASVISISGLRARWHTAYLLLFNLSYFNMELLTFGTSIFRKELLSFNWKCLTGLRFIWKYTLPFLHLRPNKITNLGYFVFNRMFVAGAHAALVLDVSYHKRTLYYLHRTGFYTVGLVPTNYPPFTVNFAIPTGVDSVFTQLFFIRFVIRVRHNSKRLRYDRSRST